MNSSGIKRGLATTAIAALAVTGVPAIANAAPLNTVVGADAVQVVNPDGGISARNDGTNGTYRLTALGGTNVTSVTFSYSLNGAAGPFVNIGSAARNDNGVFAFEWDPSSIAGAAAVTIRATATGPAAASTDDSDAPVAVNNNLATTNITNGETVGVFQQPYGAAGDNQNVIVDGTSSNAGSTPALSFFDGTTVTPAGTAVSTNAAGATTGTWAGVLDISGYDYAGANDELLVQATDVTSDTEAFALYRQTISSVTAATTTTGANSSTVVVTVLDQNQRPIAGARVASSAGGAAEFTDRLGRATFTQSAGTAYYYADATEATGYQAGLGDQRSADVTVDQYVPVATALEAESDNGTAFDIDEYDAANDITVQVNDQRGNDFGGAGQVVQYYWTLTAFDGTTGTPRTPATGTSTAVTGANGQAVVTLPYSEAGTYTLFAGVAANPATGTGAVPSAQLLQVKAGESEVVFDNTDPASAPAGGDITVTGSLELEDGTGLAGRPIDLSYTGGNAAFDQATGPDAAVRRVVTGANGAFSATLDDPATAAGVAQPTENGTIVATTADYVETGSTPADTDNPGATGDLDVIFSQATAPAASTVEITGLGGAVRPGEANTGTVLVEDASGAPIANQTVTLTVDGDTFFTDGTYTGAAGSEGGVLRSLGKSITVATDANGEADFQVGIGRSEDFDDDSEAADTVTATLATAGTTASVSDTAVANFDSTNPLNVGEITIEPTDDEGFLPEARVGDRVVFDVFVTDQFGNLTDVTVNLSDNTGFADVYGNFFGGNTAQSDFLSDGDFVAEAQQEVDQTITASYTQGSVNVDGNGNAVAGPNETVSDTYTVEWYEYNLADGTVTITSSPEGEVMVGMPVTETVRVVDSEGNPVQGLDVRFIRQGPGDSADGDANFVTTTNRNGEAFYTFVGTEAGTANITVSVTDGDDVLTAQDQVVFVAEPGPVDPDPAVVIANLSANNNGAKPDRLKVVTGEPRSAGAVVKFFRIKASGGNVQVGQGVLDDMGQLKKNVKDVNGKKFSRYFARVLPTDDSLGDRSNNTRVR
ncbi:beta strand repeat-containing protein [Nocardioides sp. Leaf285]|uniref:beta strand repeat-containing protein n=1 Tax=Nocardioides sp. Leaf285 TaxID=1736322 RepID=UPI0007039090|nr:hypothetical protein [Nocardioides sp. Leaf285]KQP66498.1 hypothetical protein ASF47_01500 [Nocardioides sp. Leaf285]